MASKKQEKSAYDKLTPAHKNFFNAYLELMNATKAYARAYPNAQRSTTLVNSAKLFNSPGIQEALKEYYDELWDKKDDYLGSTLKKLLDIIEFDISDFLTDEGELDLEKIKELNSYAIVEVTKKKHKTKYGTNETKSIKTADKNKAIEQMTKILGMIQEKVEHSGTIEVIPAERPKE